jgi:hypothetical protein
MLGRACSQSVAEYPAAMFAKGLSGDQVDSRTIRCKSAWQSCERRFLNNHEDSAYVVYARGSFESNMWWRASIILPTRDHETFDYRGITVRSESRQ